MRDYSLSDTFNFVVPLNRQFKKLCKREQVIFSIENLFQEEFCISTIIFQFQSII